MDDRAQPASPSTLSAQAERDLHARTYLLVIRPAIIGLAIVLTVVDLASDAGVTRANWIGLGAFALLQPAYWGLLRAFGPGPATTISFVLDGFVLLAMVMSIPSPDSASSALVLLVVAVAYFRSPLFTVAYAATVAIAITVTSTYVEAWDDPARVPSSAFTVFVSGVLLAILARQMRHTERRLARVVDEQDAALERLIQVDRARDRLIANVSHELRTPLTTTLGFIETLLRDDIELSRPERRRLMILARDGGRRLLSLVEDLLAIGATRPDSIALDAAPFDVYAAARESIEGLEIDGGRQLHVIERVHTDVVADRRRVEQVVANLVVNAVRHGDGDIDVICDRTPEGGAEIDVIDEGPGITPEHVRELFQPFARFSSRTDSTGLGLAICRAVVEAHGGTIDYGRTHDDRTRFRVRFPESRTRDTAT